MGYEEQLKVLKVIRSGPWALVPVHYSHDIEKASDEWYVNESAKYPDEISLARELEIDFGLHSGTPAYPAYKEDKHVVSELLYDETLPLLVAMDFNANPMSIIIAHLENGWLQVIDEIIEGPTTIDEVIQKFRDRYPAHRGDLIFYGDATRGTTAQTAKSNWMVVQAAMRAYPIRAQYRVPLTNPNIGDRLQAVNRKLLAADGQPGIKIAAKCKELRQDLREVLMTPDNKRILKIHKEEDPYFKRTHASDALGYLIYREWPVVKEAIRTFGRSRRPLNKGNVMGGAYRPSRGGRNR